MMNRGKASALLPVYAAVVTVVCPMVGAGPARAEGDLGGAVLTQINATREENGCGPVSPNPQLTAAAARQANDMLANGVVSHTGSDGSSPMQRVTDAGYVPYARIGEIIFWGSGIAGVPAAAVTTWMNSPPHRAIITDCALTDAGFSAVSNGNAVTAAGDLGRK